MHTRWLWQGIVLVSAAALVTVIATGVGAPWRTILAVWFVLTCPGASLVGVLGLRDRFAELAVVVPMSLALVTLTSVILYYGRVWSPNVEFTLLSGLCALGLIWSNLGSRSEIKGES